MTKVFFFYASRMKDCFVYLVINFTKFLRTNVYLFLVINFLFFRNV